MRRMVERGAKFDHFRVREVRSRYVVGEAVTDILEDDQVVPRGARIER